MMLVIKYFWIIWISVACIPNTTRKKYPLKRKGLKRRRLEFEQESNRNDTQVTLDYKGYFKCKESKCFHKKYPKRNDLLEQNYCNIDCDLESGIHENISPIQRNRRRMQENLLYKRKANNCSRFVGKRRSKICVCKKSKFNYHDVMNANFECLTPVDPDIEEDNDLRNNSVEYINEKKEYLANLKDKTLLEFHSEEEHKPSIEENPTPLKKDSKEKISVFSKILGFLGELLL